MAIPIPCDILNAIADIIATDATLVPDGFFTGESGGAATDAISFAGLVHNNVPVVLRRTSTSVWNKIPTNVFQFESTLPVQGFYVQYPGAGGAAARKAGLAAVRELVTARSMVATKDARQFLG